jgi:hypothetical protein
VRTVSTAGMVGAAGTAGTAGVVSGSLGASVVAGDGVPSPFDIALQRHQSASSTATRLTALLSSWQLWLAVGTGALMCCLAAWRALARDEGTSRTRSGSTMVSQHDDFEDEDEEYETGSEDEHFATRDARRSLRSQERPLAHAHARGRAPDSRTRPMRGGARKP